MIPQGSKLVIQLETVFKTLKLEYYCLYTAWLQLNDKSWRKIRIKISKINQKICETFFYLFIVNLMAPRSNGLERCDSTH